MNAPCALLVLELALAGCASSNGSHAQVAKPVHARGTSDAGGADKDAAAGTLDATSADAAAQQSLAPRPTRLVLEFTTMTLHGKYAPRNGGVAWVADAKGKWVHTFELWISGFFDVLRVYSAAGGPQYVRSDPALPPPVPPPPDVITRATLINHQTHAAETWNLKDASGNEIPDGNYFIMIEVAEQDPESVVTFPFMKAGKQMQWTSPDAAPVGNVKLTLE
jgi:hypothetical protein